VNYVSFSTGPMVETSPDCHDLLVTGGEVLCLVILSEG